MTIDVKDIDEVSTVREVQQGHPLRCHSAGRLLRPASSRCRHGIQGSQGERYYPAG